VCFRKIKFFFKYLFIPVYFGSFFISWVLISFFGLLACFHICSIFTLISFIGSFFTLLLVTNSIVNYCISLFLVILNNLLFMLDIILQIKIQEIYYCLVFCVTDFSVEVNVFLLLLECL
jgi:hypothetical protein